LIDRPATNRRDRQHGRRLDADLVHRPYARDIRVGEDIEDMGARVLGTPPPPNGTRFT